MQLTVKDTARLLQVSERTIHQWIKQDAIPVCRINEQLRFNRSGLLEWATARGIPVSPDLFRETEAMPQPPPTLSSALEAGGIAYGLGGTNKTAVLREVVRVMRLPADVDRHFLFHVLLAREMLGSTAIGDGIAIPHVRNPIVLQGTPPMIALCFLQHPINFDALDGQPVTTLFTVISPTVKSHLHVLSRLAFVLRNAEFRAALQRIAPPDQLADALACAEATIPAPRGPDGSMTTPG